MGKVTVIITVIESLLLIYVLAAPIKENAEKNKIKRSSANIAAIVLCLLWIVWRLWTTYLSYVAFWR